MKNISKSTLEILGIKMQFCSRAEFLIFLQNFFLNQERQLVHVVSINPEIFVQMQQNIAVNHVFSSATVQICDGVGIFLAGKLQGKTLPRYSGVDMMGDILEFASKSAKKVLLIGGKDDLAQKTKVKIMEMYPSLVIASTSGFTDKNNIKISELTTLQELIKDFDPDIVLLAFGSPWQEHFIHEKREIFGSALVSGVGGAFAMYSGELARAPKFFQKIGLEWFWRLIQEPWRWARQTNLIRFCILVAIDLFKRQKNKIIH